LPPEWVELPPSTPNGWIIRCRENGLLLFGSGLTDPELSMAATAHFFAWAGVDLPAAVNGPQYLVDRGTMDRSFRPRGDSLQIPAGPGLGIELTDAVQSSMTTPRAASRTFTGLTPLLR
jgi:hypothetical protein